MTALSLWCIRLNKYAVRRKKIRNEGRMVEMKLGMIRSTYPNEKRVALLPEHITNFGENLVVERGFGEMMDIPDEAYAEKGCRLADREEIFAECNAIFSLKLIQPHDYPHIRDGQMIVGWTHPEESGKKFMEAQGFPKELIIVDLDNIKPSIHLNGKKALIDSIPRNFVVKNSFVAGFASAVHAITSYGQLPHTDTKIAILAAGNVSQGAFTAVSKLGGQDIRLFYRKTMNEFKETLSDYDIIISGIEMDDKSKHILSEDEQQQLKPGALVIDAAADAGYAFEGVDYTTYEKPLYKKHGVYYYCVNNSPSYLYRESSRAISESFSKWVYSRDMQEFYDAAQTLT